MLEAIALTYASEGETVTALLDAGRGEVFAGEYHVSGQKAELLREYIAKIAALSSDNLGSVKVITPDAKVAESLRSTSAQIVLLPALQADAIARIGLRKLLASETSDPATLDANYIRRSDAELFAPKR
jgi:tRNA threonylcarbamoyladenosine biosynthesis protein TsaB